MKLHTETTCKYTVIQKVVVSNYLTVTALSELHPWFFFAVHYLSEDEAGGGGAAIGPLESAPPRVSPSVHLQEKKKSSTSRNTF